MNLKEFAEKGGVEIVRCDKEWGGTWGYKQKDRPNMTVCGFRNEDAAYKGWLDSSFGKTLKKAILSLLVETKPLAQPSQHNESE